MRKIFLVTLICLISDGVFGQSGGVVNGTRGFPVPNDTTTGTTLNSTAVIDGAGQAILATTSNTGGATYIVVGGAGISGNAVLASGGTLAPCTVDTTIASGTGGYYVVNSKTVAGECHPQSAAPASGTWVIGFLDSSSTTAGTTALVNVDGFVYGGSGGSGSSSWGSITGTLSSQADLETALNALAPLASPNFTGTPQAPTQAGTDNSQKLATTAFVQTVLAGVGAGSLPAMSSGTAGDGVTNNGASATLEAQPIFADQLTGTSTGDACDKTEVGMSKVINGGSSPTVDSRGFMSTSIPCAVPPFLPTQTGRWYPAAGAWQLSSTSLIFGGKLEIVGVNIATDASSGTIFQAKNGSWPAGLGANFGSGSFVSPPAWSSSTTYYWGNGISSTGTNYYALADGFTGSGHTPGSDWANWTLLSSVPSPVLQPATTPSGASTKTVNQNSGIHSVTLDCQYAAGSNSMTDGCIPFYGPNPQELTVLDRVMVRNATVAGVEFEDFISNGGPYSGQVVYSSANSGNDQAASKVNGSDSVNHGSQSAAINTISVSGTTATVTLSSAPGFQVYHGAFVDIINSSSAFSPMTAGDIDETTNKHGFWQVWSVESSTVFTMIVPGGTASCAFSCGTAYFFPIGINVNTSTTLMNDRGFDSWTINCSNCPSTSANSNFSDYPPLGVQVSSGNIPLRNFHVEGYRAALCIGCFGASDNEVVDNFWGPVNVHTGIVISKQFLVTNVDIRNSRFNVNSNGSTGHIVYTLIDYVNGNKLTYTNNPLIHHYWLDANQVAYFEGGNCSEMSNGWCYGSSGWTLYSNGSPVPTVNAATAQNLTGTPALPNGTTATTQGSGDNSSKLATTAYVQSQGYSTASNLVTGNYAKAGGSAAIMDSGVAAGPYAAFWAIPGSVSTSTPIACSSTAGKATVWGVSIPFPIKTSNVTYYVVSADNSGNTYDLGLYNASGSLVTHTGPLVGSSFAPTASHYRTQAWVTPSTVIQPGDYWLALTCGATSGTASFGYAYTWANAPNTLESLASGGTLPGSITIPGTNSFSNANSLQVVIY